MRAAGTWVIADLRRPGEVEGIEVAWRAEDGTKWALDITRDAVEFYHWTDTEKNALVARGPLTKEAATAVRDFLGTIPQ